MSVMADQIEAAWSNFPNRDTQKRPPQTHFSIQDRAYYRFKALGEDTLDLAKRYSVSEAVVLRWISEARSARLNLPTPYEQSNSIAFPSQQSKAGSTANPPLGVLPASNSKGAR